MFYTGIFKIVSECLRITFNNAGSAGWGWRPTKLDNALLFGGLAA
jgi:hypothetical protein